MLPKIVLRQSSIVINNYELGDSLRLESNFELYDKITHSTYFKAMEYDEKNKQLILPRGIDVPYLENIFDCRAVVQLKCDPFDRISQTKIKYAPRDDVQKKAICFMNGINGYEYTKNKSQLSVNLNTGKGKTYCTIFTGVYQRVRSAIITSSTTWLNQWQDCIMEYTDTKSSEIYNIIGGGSIGRILNRDMDDYKFVLISHSTIQAYGNKYGWDKVGELFAHLRIGFKAYDEAHLSFDNMAKIDFHTNTKMTYYITATPARSDQEENAIFSLYFKNVPSISLFDENNDPHTDYIAMKYSSKPSAFDITNCNTTMGFSAANYANYVVTRPNFLKLLKIVTDMAIRNSGKNLFYVATIDAMETIYYWIINNFPEIANEVGMFHSKVKENKEEQLNKKIILSTVKSVGPAIDIKGLKMVVVLAQPFKSEVTARQTLGRTRDDNTVYIDIIDKGFKACTAYMKYKFDTYKKYAKTYNILDMSDDDLDERCRQIDNMRPRLMNCVNFGTGLIYPVQFYNKKQSTTDCVIFDK